MDKKTVYFKTAKADNAGAELSVDLKRVLAFIDDKTPSDDLVKRAPPSLRKKWNELINELVIARYLVGKSVPVEEIIAAQPKTGTAMTPVAVAAGISRNPEPIPSAEELDANSKSGEALRARAELKAFFATAKVKSEAEAKAARAEAKARQEAEKAAKVSAAAEAKVRHEAVMHEQAIQAKNEAVLAANQKAALVRAELESAVLAAKLRSDADVKAKVDAKLRLEADARAKAEAKVAAKVRQDMEKALQARVDAENKAQQEALRREQAELAQNAIVLAAKLKAEEAARVCAELEAAAIAAQARADAEARIRLESENAALGRADVESRVQKESEILAPPGSRLPDTGFSPDAASDAGSYIMSAQYGGMDGSVAKRLRELENENSKLKALLADAHLEIAALRTTFGVKR